MRHEALCSRQPSPLSLRSNACVYMMVTRMKQEITGMMVRDGNTRTCRTEGKKLEQWKNDSWGAIATAKMQGKISGRREAVEIMDELWRKRTMKMKENGDSAKRIAPKRPWDLAEFLCIRWNIGHFRQHVILTTYNITRGDPNLLTLLTATTPYLTREACPSLSCLALLTSQMHYVNVYGPPWLPVVVDNIMWIITFLIFAYKTFKL